MKKNFLAAIVLGLLLIATNSKAQNVSQMLKDWERAKTYTRHYLDAMPAEYYDFKPTPQMKSFAEQMLHFTDANFELAPLAGGLQSPMAPGAAFKSADKSKPATIKMVMAGYDFVMDNIKNMQPGQMEDSVKVFDKFTMTKGNLLSKIFEHQTHHRGQTTVYIRLKGIKPPDEELFN